MIHVDLPYDYGTFVKVKAKDSTIFFYGTVAAYMVSYDGYLVWVSGYRESWCGEYLPEEVEPMTKKEIAELKRRHGE